MKNLVLSGFLIFIFIFLHAAEPPRTPFIILKVDGVEYQAGAEIEVRMGEKITVEAILNGGRRDYCSNPQKYANIGANTVVESQGENGMSFIVNQGQFRGDWKLISEKATFKSGPEITIVPKSSGIQQRHAEVEFKRGQYSKIFFKVNSEALWHYVRLTPAGKTEKDETDIAEATFYFVVKTEEGVWFSSPNVKATGQEDLSVRSNLTRIQESYDRIETAVTEGKYSVAQMHFGNLRTSVEELRKLIADARKKDSKYQCEVLLIGLPTDKALEHSAKLNEYSGKLRQSFDICTENVQRINPLLLNTQMVLSYNILKSVVKNYINWGTSIPTSIEDMLTLYDPNNIIAPIDLPRKVLGWYEEAENDASILKNQANNIKNLSVLRDHYQSRIDGFVSERKAVTDVINKLKPAADLHKEMEAWANASTVVNFQAKRTTSTF